MAAPRRIALAIVAALIVACSGEPSTREPSGGIRVEGEVLEQIDAPPYSYLRVRTDDGEVWAAVPVAAGRTPKRVALVHGVRLKQYQAVSIGRRFDVIVFGTLEGR